MQIGRGLAGLGIWSIIFSLKVCDLSGYFETNPWLGVYGTLLLQVISSLLLPQDQVIGGGCIIELIFLEHISSVVWVKLVLLL